MCVYIYLYICTENERERDEIWGLYFYWLLQRINYTARARLNYCKCLYERHHLIINSPLQIKGTYAKMAWPAGLWVLFKIVGEAHSWLVFCQTGWKKRQGKISLQSGLYPSLPDVKWMPRKWVRGRWGFAESRDKPLWGCIKPPGWVGKEGNSKKWLVLLTVKCILQSFSLMTYPQWIGVSYSWALHPIPVRRRLEPL